MDCCKPNGSKSCPLSFECVEHIFYKKKKINNTTLYFTIVFSKVCFLMDFRFYNGAAEYK